MRGFLVVASVLAVSAVAADANAQTAGINMGAPVWNGVVAVDAMQAAVSTGAPHVRVNFRLDDWKSPSDPGFFAAYDQIIDGITSNGLEVYGLLSDELAPEHDRLSPEFAEQYVKFATAVIDRYKDRVRVWETINEPNDWAGGTSARFPAATFADVHGKLYSAVKVAHPGDACWDVKIVTGPLFSFDGNSSASYLADVINAGRAGGGWKGVRDVLGKDPIDDVGYHIYVAQGTDSSEGDVGTSAGANLDSLKSVLAARGLGDKKIWISEIGYQAELLGDEGQATRLDSTFAALGARGDVASIQWFTIGDFGGLGWGLHKEGSFAAKDRRPAYEKFVNQAKAYAPELAAKLVVELPKQVEIGKPVVAKVTATNLGKHAWGDDVRVGAASGCPAAWSINGWAWSPAAGEGYAKSLTDARRFLPKGKTVAQGESITVDVALATPAALGKQRFAARMLEEGVAWFGATASADVDVVPAGTIVPPGEAPGGPGGTTPGGPSGGKPVAQDGSDGASASDGCTCREAPSRSDASGAARGVSFAGLLIGLGLVARRRLARR